MVARLRTTGNVVPAEPMEAIKVEATPYNWPFDGSVAPDRAALIIIDMQVDFCGEGGYVDEMGYDISLTRATIEPIRQLAERCARSTGHDGDPYARGPSARIGRSAG